MDLRTHILNTAEHAFDEHGFTGTGMDQLTEAADLSIRTFYRHAGSKSALIEAVLEQRRQRFRSFFTVDGVDDLFSALERWTIVEGARGCLFFRAQAETGGGSPKLSEIVAAYHQELSDTINRVVANDVGQCGPTTLAEQILVLFEGAVSAASYRGANAVKAARTASAILIRQARDADVG